MLLPRSPTIVQNNAFILNKFETQGGTIERYVVSVLNPSGEAKIIWIINLINLMKKCT